MYLITKTFIVYENGTKDNMDNHFEVPDFEVLRTQLIEKYNCKMVYFSFIDMDLGDKCLKNINERIDNAIIESFNVPAEYLTTRSRKRIGAEVRQFAMWWRMQNTNESLAAIGLKYGNRDHATVLHAKKTVDSLILTNKEFREKANLALTKLEQIKF